MTKTKKIALCAVLIALALAGISVSISIKSAAHGKISRSALILKDETPAAENEELSDMIFEPNEVSILGKVIGLMRNYRA